MRLIDADALIEDLRRRRKHSADAEDIHAAPRVPSLNGWISVKDRLPDRQCEVLAYYGYDYSMDSDMEYMTMGVLKYYAHDPNPHFQHESTGLCVTHWMPLPEPPKTAKVCQFLRAIEKVCRKHGMSIGCRRGSFDGLVVQRCEEESIEYLHNADIDPKALSDE